ncbi:MAG: hypothetical protein EOP45_10480 [Sphingobacteriaceae bacterium]|nr:MAG: hypothetical protein EOP45_10480 [Sphingobacteriaceae bacterium]
MKLKMLRINTLIMSMAFVIVIIAGCKKEHQKTDPPVVTQLPDSVMFLNTFDSNSGTSIYVLNAITGLLTTKYTYPPEANTTWSYPVAGNGFLYSLQTGKINAINMNTGAVIWTDAISNVSVPVLHDQTFYGVYSENTTSYFVYALDATKPTKEYLWKYQVTIPPLQINYYNGIIYVSLDQMNLTALDAKTGILKWKTGTGYSLATLNEGIIMAGNTILDASSGTQIGTVGSPAIPPAFGTNTVVAQPALQYATKELYFVQNTHYNTPPGLSKLFLSAIDRTGVENWRINYGGGQATYDTSNTITQSWKNKLIVKRFVNTGAGKYGYSTAENYRIIDINTGSVILKFDDDGKGKTVSSYIADNNMYFHKRFVSTLNGLPSTPPPANYLFTINLLTGKQKWSNDKLVESYDGSVSSCVFAGGKGFSPLIQ